MTAEWQRLDAMAGVVLQTGSAALVAAATFLTQTDEGDVQFVLGIVALLAFWAAIAAVGAVGVTSSAIGDDLTTLPTRYKNKRRCANTALYCLLFAVEFGTPCVLMALLFD